MRDGPPASVAGVGGAGCPGRTSAGSGRRRRRRRQAPANPRQTRRPRPVPPRGPAWLAGWSSSCSPFTRTTDGSGSKDVEVLWVEGEDREPVTVALDLAPVDADAPHVSSPSGGCLSVRDWRGVVFVGASGGRFGGVG